MASAAAALLRLILSLCLLLPFSALAHEHHGEEIPDGETISAEPLDTILWIHILLMILSFGILFPLGMVLGLVRSRFHVPLQVGATCLTILAWFLGHAHKGRQFAENNVHASFAPWLMGALALQVGLGVFLRLHILEKWRRIAAPVHSVVGKTMPVLGWTQMCFGGITALGFCGSAEDHLGQCVAHFIMGSSFIGYGVVMTLMMPAVGQAWLKRHGRSQEFWDSLVITAWGCVNTFAMHRWGQGWAHNDIQHTAMGVVWWCAGMLGLWMARNGRRNVIPGVVILVTGWAMSAHPQHVPLSTMVHAVFGYTLMAAGMARIIEVAFVVHDKPTTQSGEPSSFQHMPPLLLFASGIIFMCATEEQMALISDSGIDHVSYLLVLYGLSSLLYLFTQILVHVFVRSSAQPAMSGQPRDMEGHQLRTSTDEVELEGLIDSDSDEEEEEDEEERGKGDR